MRHAQIKGAVFHGRKRGSRKFGLIGGKWLRQVLAQRCVLVRREVGNSDMADFACFTKTLQCFSQFAGMGEDVWTVNLIQIYGVYPKASQRIITGLREIFFAGVIWQGWKNAPLVAIRYSFRKLGA